jgi:hypothetical protein
MYGLGGGAPTATASSFAGLPADANTGGGGGGAQNATSQLARSGGVGGTGKVIVWEFIGSAITANNMVGTNVTGIIYKTKTTIFSASTTWVPDPAMGFAIVKVQAAGGIGGTANATSTTTLSSGSGGGGGGFCMSFYTLAQVNALPSKTITLSGTNASFSSSGSLMSAAGGSNGVTGTAQATQSNTAAALGGPAVGGNIFNGTGQSSTRIGWNFTAGFGMPPGYSNGGGGYMGLGGGRLGGAGDALTGGGGGGASNGISASVATGGDRGTNYVEITEFLIS